MKPVQIEFVQPWAWKFIWSAAALALLAIATATGVKVWQLQQQRTTLEQQLSTLQAQQLQQRLALGQAAEQPKDSPRGASEAAANRLLQRDWNRLYDAIETPVLAKVRLVQLSLDAVTGQAMLEFELDSMEQAAEVTQALNDASGQGGVWQLERLENAAQGGAVGVGRVRGVWRAVFE